MTDYIRQDLEKIPEGRGLSVPGIVGKMDKVGVKLSEDMKSRLSDGHMSKQDFLTWVGEEGLKRERLMEIAKRPVSEALDEMKELAGQFGITDAKTIKGLSVIESSYDYAEKEFGMSYEPLEILDMLDGMDSKVLSEMFNNQSDGGHVPDPEPQKREPLAPNSAFEIKLPGQG